MLRTTRSVTQLTFTECPERVRAGGSKVEKTKALHSREETEISDSKVRT